MATETRTPLVNDLAGSTRKSTDEMLILAAKSGNGSAFVELSRPHSKRIQLMLFRILGNWEDAEDVLQEALLKAFIKLAQFRGASQFSTWLTQIETNSALMEIRKRRARPEISYDRHPDSVDGFESFEFHDLSPSPERLCADRETEELLRNAILRLPWLYRSVFELFYKEDLSTIETAQVIGISAAAANSRLLRARTTLRGSLRKLGLLMNRLDPSPAGEIRLLPGVQPPRRFPAHSE